MSTLFGQPDPASARPPQPGDRYAQVAVHRGLERSGRSASEGKGGAGIEATLLYRVPAEMAKSARVGQLVTAPLGKAGKGVTGVIVELGGAELLGDLPPGKVKALTEVSPAALPAGLLDLAKWIAQYYVCPLGMVMLALMPAAVKKQTGRKGVMVLRLSEEAGKYAEDAAGAEKKSKTGQRRDGDDRVQSAPLGKRLLEKLAEVRAIEASAWPLTVRALCAAVPGLTTGAVRKLLDAGVLTSQTQSVVSAHADPLLEEAMAERADRPSAPTLTPEQARVVGAIEPTLGRFGVHLIRGITGSGKTEVYMRLIQRALEADAGAGAIILVPEIALTPQTARRFLDRFGAGAVAVLHSALSESQRHAQWQAAADGRVRVVVGARSAIFAPLPKVRLIAVDEEHDSSYKQDQLPRYHARDVAVKRAQIEGCPVILGSATPSMESWANTKGSAGSGGKYTLHELTTRATGARLPQVRIVDLMDERRRRASASAESWRDRQLHLIGPTLEAEIGRALGDGGQVILLLNRRGFANYLCCPDPNCGFVMRCEHCDATVVYHRGEHFATGGSAGFVRCHHCLAELLLPASCPQCKVKKLNTFGLGTQRVEEELSRKFASAGLVTGETMLRVDSDTMRSARDYFTALSRFTRGEAKVLLGTQMIAKGLDFPNVQLVGIISADTALNLPDFRAAERTFQLVCQVAGRAGRGERAGLVIVQTAQPGAPPIVLAARHDYVAFADQELAVRKSAGLPPATRMARVVCRDTDPGKASSAAHEVAAALRQTIASLPAGAVTLQGPMPCAIARIDDHHRLAILLIGRDRGAIQSVLGRVRTLGLLKSDSKTAVDVDPVALL